MVFLEVDTLQLPPTEKKLKVLDLAPASRAAVAGILHARHSPPSMHTLQHPPDLRGRGKTERGRWRELYLLHHRRRLPPDLAAIHRIWPPSTGFQQIELAGCRMPTVGEASLQDARPVVATRRLGAQPHVPEEGMRVATYAGGGPARPA
jgi:hypothetical protein